MQHIQARAEENAQLRHEEVLAAIASFREYETTENRATHGYRESLLNEIENLYGGDYDAAIDQRILPWTLGA